MDEVLLSSVKEFNILVKLMPSIKGEILMKKYVLSTFVTVMMMGSLVACGKTGSSDHAIKKSANEVTVVKADYPQYNSTKELEDAADLIFTGRIVGKHSEMLDIRETDSTDSVTGVKSDAKLPYTIYDIKISKMYKGSSEDKIIQIKCVGGTVDGVVYESDMANRMEEDGAYLFLAKTFENSYPSLVNDTQALYDLNEKGNKAEVDEIMNLCKQ
ncbi:hypothetical protein SAMN02910400_02304 [Lachnospiraceae bacterium C10]|nr:hypothetical protein SAMN02910400_02304 [Lachnospiraceae bacterium C10]